MKRVMYILGLLLLSLFLAACGGASELKQSESDAPENKVFDAVAGIGSYSDRAGASFMVMFNSSEDVGEVRVSVLGPSGWNDGAAARWVVKNINKGRKTAWFTVFRNRDGELMDAVKGSYILQADILGETYRKEVTIDPRERMAQPEEVRVSAESSVVNASWDAPAGAVSYFVTLRRVDGSAEPNKTLLYTRDTSVVFGDLSLVPGEEYKIGVTAFPVDFTDRETASFPSGSFNTSFKNTLFTAP